jgi:transcriptional regulator with XRE-family HTH domain
MTPTQFRAALDRLSLTQAGAAEFLGISIRSAHGYANGKPVPEPVAKLLRLMISLDLKPADVK